MRYRDVLEAVATTTLVICALVVTVTVVRRGGAQEGPGGPRPPKNIRNWQIYVSETELIGDLRAPIKVVLFSDYQCPFCKQIHETLVRLQQKRPGELVISHRNFPIAGLHPYARAAALAAYCAADQGRFSEYHSLLFENQVALSTFDYVSAAQGAGVPRLDAFRQCLRGEDGAEVLRADSIAAMKLNLTGTPLVMINGWVFDGTPSEAQIEDLLSGKADFTAHPDGRESQ